METYVLYLIFLAGIGLSRHYEVRLSKRYLSEARKSGDAKPAKDWTFPLMVLFHTTWLVACGAEVILLERPYLKGLGALMLLMWALAFLGRIWMLGTLQESWNVRIINNPNQRIITEGPYQYIRHPNYLIVIVEIFAIPMIHSAYLTAILGSLMNGVLIWGRIRNEESYLNQFERYRLEMSAKPRFMPREVQNGFHHLNQQVKQYFTKK